MNTEEISEVWQAICTLSEAQTLIDVGARHHEADHPDTDLVTWETASNRINHAKRHLINVLDTARRGDEPAFREAVLSNTRTCTLEEGGH